MADYLHGDEFDQVLARVVYTSPLSSAEDSVAYLVPWYLTDHLNWVHVVLDESPFRYRFMPRAWEL
ncbi:MAG: hypothetical protein RMJ82_14530 [Gemmatales bacterium]|nr:hypothetical protein [Gemmatales bacterium]